MRKQRIAVDKATKAHAKASKGKNGANPTPRDLTVALEKLVRMSADMSKEWRQLKKSLDADEMTDDESHAVLIEAGWKPPS